LDSGENVLAECRDCHDPHYQKQKTYKNTDWTTFYLATGTIIGCVYNGDGTSTLTYDSITYKTGWDATKLIGKKDICRHTILFPNVKKLGYSYPIIEVDNPAANTITVKGDATPVYAYISESVFVVLYGQYIKDNINGKPVKFFSKEGQNSFAFDDDSVPGPDPTPDDDPTPEGVCQVCHTSTQHWLQGGALADHFDGFQCTACHPHVEGFNPSSNDCMGCHSYSFNKRAAITQQFSANSHHVQGVALDNTHCYECHWEAKADSTINNPYHEGYNTETKSYESGAKVDLVIYGAGTRPDTYTAGTTVVQYIADVADADGKRTQIKNLNTHCLSCHSDQNNDTMPFGETEGKTPRQYAWDNMSIKERYSQTETTTWGKYTNFTNAAKKNITKAFSAHGKATLNEGGWSPISGVDESIPNARNGDEIVACFDCHNSHGSSVQGSTTSYTSATTNGGILKDTRVGRGGYSVTYKPKSGGLETKKNAYKAGAGLCFDCHLNEFANETPWGYKSTFGATEPVMGYWDTPYFGDDTFASQRRYTYKITPHHGGHFGKSSGNGYPHFGGLCTPCHDPHGVSPTIEQDYAVPLLKGTWLTSPYKEDTAPADKRLGTIRTDIGAEGIPYHLDQNTFGIDILDHPTGITESEEQFAGLCLKCHPKITLRWPDGFPGDIEWKGKYKIHESVKGWDDGERTKHRYPCSKCHTVHNSRLPRLMVTNCLDYKHKAYMGNNLEPRISGEGEGYSYYNDRNQLPEVCEGQSSTILGKCRVDGLREPKTIHSGHQRHFGYGRFPGSYKEKIKSTGYPIAEGRNHDIQDIHDFYEVGDFLGCHENRNSPFFARHYAQSWNNVTEWDEGCGTPPEPEDCNPQILSGPFASNFTEDGNDIQATITWKTREKSTSYVDYGLDPLGVDPDPLNCSGVGNDNMETTHSITLTGLTNHRTYYYRVCSKDEGGTVTKSDDHTFYISMPPSVPILHAMPEIDCTVPCDITFSWDPSTDPDSGPIEYFVEVQENTEFNNPVYISGWISETTWIITMPPGYWCWRVRARDGNHPEAVSDWTEGWPWQICFSTIPLPSTPTLIAEPDVVSTDPVLVTLEWNQSTSPLGNDIQYLVQVNDSDFWWGIDHESGWISGNCAGNICSWTIEEQLDPGTTCVWRVRARDAVYTNALSGWSASDTFNIFTSNPPPAPQLNPEPDVPEAVPVSVTLEWQPAIDPDGDPVEYYVEWSHNPSFTLPFNSGWISGTNRGIYLHYDWIFTWYWRVKARDADHTDAVSAWSDVDSFDIHPPPQAPFLTDELDIITDIPVEVTLEWAAVTCPDGHAVEYYVEVDNDSDFSSPEYYPVVWLSSNNWSVTVANGTRWYWRVKARDAVLNNAESAWSAPDNFYTFAGEPPPAPTLTDEPDLLTTVPVLVNLQWETVTCPDGDPAQYYVEVDDAPDFGSPEYNTTDWINNTFWDVIIDTATTWYWRVRARDAVHQSWISLWSDVDSFQLYGPPPAPTLIPEDDYNSGGTPELVTLEWGEVTDPDGNPVEYLVELYDNPGYSGNPYFASEWITEANYTITLGPCTEWWWRVKARDAVDTWQESGWSNNDSFADTLLSGPECIAFFTPSVPTLVDEPDCVTTIPCSVTLTWNESTVSDEDAIEYYVEVDNDVDFSSPNFISGWISEMSYGFSVSPNNNGYWRVQARNANHIEAVSDWSLIDKFRVVTPADYPSYTPSIPFPIAEPDNSCTSPCTVTLQWNSSTNPAGNALQYRVGLDNNEDFSSPEYVSSWMPGTNDSGTFTPDINTTWWWRVQSRDAVTLVVSYMSAKDSFKVADFTLAVPTLEPEPDHECAVACPVTLEWNEVTAPDGSIVEYYVEVDNNLTFTSVEYESGWITGISFMTTIDLNPNPWTYWYWRVRARDANHREVPTNWSSGDSFQVLPP
jgi:hypothetical protein